MGRLTTHVLDTTHGRPGAAIRVTVYRLDGEQRHCLKQSITNQDGRCDAPLLDAEELQPGVYELVFAAGDYFRALAGDGASADAAGEPRFLDEVVIRFGVAEPEQHYHVPLLISPYSYSTYRGS